MGLIREQQNVKEGSQVYNVYQNQGFPSHYFPFQVKNLGHFWLGYIGNTPNAGTLATECSLYQFYEALHLLPVG